MVLALAIAGLSVPGFAWEGDDWLQAYWSTEMEWTQDEWGYGREQYVIFSEYKSYGQPTSVAKTNDGSLYPEARNLDDIDLVARVIFAKIVNVPPREDNAFAVAQVIKNRMGTSNTARSIVTARYQFSSISDGNPYFGNPSKYNDPQLWAQCVFLAGCLVNSDSIPLKYPSGNPGGEHTNIGTRIHFYDIQYGMPFYDINKVACTTSNITTKAYYYKAGTTYNKILTSPIKIGSHVYFKY